MTLGMLKMKEPHLKSLENSAQIFNALSDTPGDIDDVEKLLEVCCLFDKVILVGLFSFCFDLGFKTSGKFTQWGYDWNV